MDDSRSDAQSDASAAAPDAASGAAAGAGGGSAAPPRERLEARVVGYWYLTDLARALVFAAVLVAGSWLWGESDRRRPDWVPHVALGLGGALVLIALVVPPLAYERWRFGVDDRLLAMRYGILFVEERIVPVPRMQHVDLTRGPVERLFGLATLVVFTAGNEGSAFRVPGLSRARAEQIRDRILEARGHDFL